MAITIKTRWKCVFNLFSRLNCAWHDDHSVAWQQRSNDRRNSNAWMKLKIKFQMTKGRIGGGGGWRRSRGGRRKRKRESIRIIMRAAATVAAMTVHTRTNITEYVNAIIIKTNKNRKLWGSLRSIGTYSGHTTDMTWRTWRRQCLFTLLIYRNKFPFFSFCESWMER